MTAPASAAPDARAGVCATHQDPSLAVPALPGAEVDDSGDDDAHRQVLPTAASSPRGGGCLLSQARAGRA